LSIVSLTPTGDFTGNAFLESTTSHENTVVYVQGKSYVALTAPSGSYIIK
jgi:Ni,Fe-hydrogenase I cytochrome b subunit